MKAKCRQEGEEVLRARAILEVLRKNFSIPDFSSICKDPFSVLVRTIISQSTAETNTRRAFENLSARMQITPSSLAKAPIRDIEDALRVAGLYRNKSVVLKKLSAIILEKFDGKLDFIYSLPLSDARKKLLSLPGVGPKTADIILLFCAKRPVLPVDTHVRRVSKRLGLVSENEKRYDDIRVKLERLYDSKDYFAVHMLFIALGRKFCRALRPLCSECLVNKLCPSAEF
ncbi:MAG TPA: endonuclease III [Candidatus Bathyarchaeota archaeon]|nr:endonuclease III [Candidatus Bathyarchaeota archaeon]